MIQTRLILWLFFCLPFLEVFSLHGDTLSRDQIFKDGDYLSSARGRFELGFFSPGASKSRYLGIWYTNGEDAVVWVANRENPIPDRGGSLVVDESGNLTILNSKKTVIWSSNVTSSSVNSVAQLLESGNFVLRVNSDDSILWQSFDHPTDTLLPGMKIGLDFKTGRESFLTSWRNLDDPSSGLYTYKVHVRSLAQVIIFSGSVQKYRTGPWRGALFDALAAHDIYNLSRLVMEINENEAYHSYEAINSSVFTRLTLNESGELQRYVKYEKTESWNNFFWLPFDFCDNYARCGINDICSVNGPHPCQCLAGFKRGSGSKNWNSMAWDSSTKCVRISALNCPKGEGFVRILKAKLPDMINFTWNQDLNLQQCESECLKNCSCTAYANLDINGSGKGCMMWFGDLIDVKYLDYGNKQPVDLFIRVPHSELVTHPKQKTKLWIALSVSMFLAFMFLTFVYFIKIRRRLKECHNKMDEMEVPFFEFSSLDKATGGFAEENILGEGGFGVVYKGNLSTGQDVAIKRLSRYSGQGVEEFRNEVTLIAKLQHRNLVNLLGTCIKGEERILIYEFMPNKSLDYFLFDKKETKLKVWKERFNIVMGIARGLLYLHQDSKLHVVHRDLKAANILLDSNMNPKISDFGIARIFDGDAIQGKTKRVMGTYGYMSPEYAIHGTFSDKSDVFSFGVLVLEIVSSTKNRGFSHSDHSQSLLGHAWLLWTGRKGLELVDPNLQSSMSMSEALRCIHVALLCVQRHAADRPDMSTVVFMLANDGINLPEPKQPGFFFTESDYSSEHNSLVGFQTYQTDITCSLTMLEPS